jgi:hypothetical protein
LKPSKSAPASAHANASSKLVMPQIFIRTIPLP